MFHKWMVLIWKVGRSLAGLVFAKSAWSSLQDDYADELSSCSTRDKPTGSNKQPCCEVWRLDLICWRSQEFNSYLLSKQITQEICKSLRVPWSYDLLLFPTFQKCFVRTLNEWVHVSGHVVLCSQNFFHVYSKCGFNQLWKRHLKL